MKNKILTNAVTVLALFGLLLASGCVSDPELDRKVTRYRPNVGNRDIGTWQAVDEKGSSQSGNTVDASWTRPLRRGDKVMIYLRGIPRPEEKPDIVDDRGEVSLPLINKIKIEGLTTSEAEDLIEKAYVNGGYYKKIAITIVAQEDEYYIRGEVKRPGKYPLRPGMTLLQAISAAMGYTDFAKPKDIQLTRGGKNLQYNAKRIGEGEEKDPIIKPGDNIVVGRKIFL